MLWSQTGSYKYIDFKLKKILRPKALQTYPIWKSDPSCIEFIAICTLYDGALACNSLFYMLL